ncbi:MAG TPA: hypothetical protein EYP56_05610 [Planctomycetaceae bacterium]|nr:hypothetical protein [Planctomycetaceae bacterium]HIQ21785.1 hypothetical protein [Planctomycetota bacterium]
MSPRASFYRKIIYLAAVSLLLAVLYPVSHPSTSGGDPGGVLAQVRHDHQLTEAQLGDIDPTGETIKLATFGLRGVAANILWTKAFNYKKKKDWTKLSATLQQIIKLQPHFLVVWRFQAHNLSYNVSAEFDDYRQRFLWVIKGIEFLKQGVRYNEREPRLYSDIGWFTSQKIGRADEHKQFRVLFRDPEDFYGVFAQDPVYPPSARPMEFRDNWLVGKDWYARAEEVAEREHVPVSEILFYSHRPKCQMNYAEALEEDGVFKEKARQAWSRAEREWNEYGNRELTVGRGQVIRLNDFEQYAADVAKYREQLEAMAPGLRKKLQEEKRARLSKAEREALDTPPEKRTQAQWQLAGEAEAKLVVDHREVAQRVTGSKRRQALELAQKLRTAERLGARIEGYRSIVAFPWWRMHAQVEQTPEALAARELIYEADEAYRLGDLVTAKAKYDAGLEKWREVLDNPRFPTLVGDGQYGRELRELIGKYQRVLDKRDEPFPEDFILQDIIDRHGEPIEP